MLGTTVNIKLPVKRTVTITGMGSFLLIWLLAISCNTMSFFDGFSYKETISAKVEALALMDKATNDYSQYSDEIESTMKQMKKIYEYEKNRPKNIETTKMWEILLDPDKNLFGGFLKKWEQNGTMGEMFVSEMKLQVEEAFNIIIDLENNKNRNKERANNFISNQ